MIAIGMSNIHKNYGYKNILTHLDLEIMAGERVALVGRNGSGKTTILKLIAGEETPDQGTVSIRRGASLGMLSQFSPSYSDNTTPHHILMDSFSPLLLVQAEMEQVEQQLAVEQDSEKLTTLMDSYSELQNRFLALDGYSMEERFQRIVQGFSLTALLDRPFSVLSGGEKTIVHLAATILKQPDILLLDEPTNHLDVTTLEWFEDFLSKYRGTVVIVSHDRYFLDRVANKTILLENGVCTTFWGNYSFAIAEQERLLLLEFEQYKNQQRKISAMKEAIARFQDWGSRGDNPKFFKKAKELTRRLEKIEQLNKPQLEKNKLPLHFSGSRSGKEVLRLEDFSLSIGGAVLLDSTQLLLLEGERLCLMGDNGSGKTTLIRRVLGEDIPFVGKFSSSPSCKLGYIPQEIRFPNPKATVLETFRQEHPCSEGEARGNLSQFFFCGERVFQSVGNLSGGEKVLLKLALLIQQQINFLILDEPTNHIDIDTRELLEDALLDFRGTILFVSHDRYFIHKIATRCVEIQEKKLQSREPERK